jgi:hypothetical protein
MPDHVAPNQGEEAEVPSSGLLLSVEPLQNPAVRLKGDDDSDTGDAGVTDAIKGDDDDSSGALGDSDSSDSLLGDSDGSDAEESDADGTDAEDADGTDTGRDADGTDPLGIASDKVDADTKDRG